MRKVWKRITALAAAVLMALAMTVTAAAADETIGSEELGTKGTITVGSAIEGQTYTIYKIFDLESYDTEKNAYAYRVNDTWKTFVSQYAVEGSENRYFEIDDQDYITMTKKFTEGAAAEFAQAALAWAKENAVANQGAQTAGADTVIFENLELGYYLLDSTTGALCGLDTTNNEVDIREKNDVPEVEKNVKEGDNWQDHNTAGIGDTVEFYADITAKAGAEHYVLHDTMNETDGLTFDGEVRVVYIANGTTEEAAMGKDTDYTFSMPGTEGDTPCTFEVQILKALNPGDVVRVYYSATINENAVIRNEIVNKVELQYGDDKYVTDQTITKVYDFNVFKHDVDGKALANATFVLSEKEKLENTGTDGIKLVDKANQVYRVAKQGDEVTLFEITTGDTGRFEIQGLDAGTYYLHETKAPEGYNKLKAPIKVVIDQDGNVTYRLHTVVEEGADEKFEHADSFEVSVENKTGFELPSTGGMGTTVLYVAGILVIGAAVFYVAMGRKSRKH